MALKNLHIRVSNEEYDFLCALAEGAPLLTGRSHSESVIPFRDESDSSGVSKATGRRLFTAYRSLRIG